MEIIWLNHAAFKVKTNSGKVIYLDPYKVNKSEDKADIIICSHDHGDHFDERSIKNLIKENTMVLGPASISSSLNKFNGKGLKYHEPYSINDIKIELVPAYNLKRMRPGTNEPFHPKKNQWAGSILEIEGKKIYHAGDTENIPEIKELKARNIDVAILPCGGTYTMDFEESTDAALAINPKIVLPMHNWDKKLDDYVKIMHKKNPSIKVEVLIGKTLKL
jgi:L-ascorbate metabolism protein UlaG (beta-lactamase superfamily)